MNKSTATLLNRTKSSTIDTLILIVTSFAIVGVLSYFENVPTWIRSSLFVLLVIYEPVCITYGATIGNCLMNIRVRRSTDESKRLNILRSLVRFLSKLLLGWISYVTVFRNPRKRAIHDLIAGSTTIDELHKQITDGIK